MPENWKTYKLKNVALLKRGYDLPSRLRKPGNYDIISSSGVTDRHEEYKIKGPGVVTGRYGTIGKVFYTESNFWPLNTSLYVKDFKGNNPKFIYYLLQTINWNSYSTKSAVPGIDRNEVHQEKVIVPELPEQKSIASILSALDDKIELNLQMNKTLEEMAMTLYKHWFVDFGPFQEGEFVDSELGEIPKGWEVKPIGDVIETLGGGTPKTKVQEYWENGNIDWYSPTDLTKANSLFSFGTAKKITKKGLEKSSAKMFPARSLLMSSRATIGAITINRKPACTNQGFITMIPNETLTLFQLHGWTVNNMNLIISKANGSTFKEISKANFRALPILIGSGISEYIKEVENYYAQIESNLLENQTITQLRDTLLPKLISGEVRVKDVEKTLSEAL